MKGGSPLTTRTQPTAAQADKLPDCLNCRMAYQIYMCEGFNSQSAIGLDFYPFQPVEDCSLYVS